MGQDAGEGTPDIDVAIGTGDEEEDWTGTIGLVVERGARDGEVACALFGRR